MASLVPNEKVAIVNGRVGLAEDLRAGIAAGSSGDKAKANSMLRDVRARAADAGDVELKERMDGIYDEEQRHVPARRA